MSHEYSNPLCPHCHADVREGHRFHCPEFVSLTERMEKLAGGTKPSNPKDAVGIKKAPMSTVSAPVMLELGTAMLEGALKYGRHNYRTIGVRGSVYYDATMRHLMQWWEGEDVDPDSGLSHITKAIASLVVLRDAMLQSKFNDDRPPKASAQWYGGLNKRAGELIDKYPEPKAAFTEKAE